MNRREHLFTILSEECSEVIHAVCKTLRFGPDEGRDIDRTNLQRLKEEFNQMLAVADMLSNEGVDLRDDLEVQQKKKDKVEEYLKYSVECGTLYDNIEGLRSVSEDELEEYFATMQEMLNKRDDRKRKQIIEESK